MTKFKDRYVLAEGYPWAIGTQSYKSIGVSTINPGIILEDLDFPLELWSAKVPTYRLVLERIHPKKTKEVK